jgi:hypothetical protein
MTSHTKRLLLLGVILLAGFGATFLLPEVSPMRSSLMHSEMPATFDNWGSQGIPVSKRELEVLAKDTHFERRIYSQLIGSGRPAIEASIVFSGKDINNSIHRPEVCLVTQGWNFVRQRYITLPDMLPGNGEMVVRELVCKRTRRDEKGDPILLPDGRYLEDWQLLYYTFIGATETTASHYGRTFIDIRDRVLGGYDQQWAYATFSSQIIGKYRDQGVPTGNLEPLDLDQTGRHIESFMRELMPKVIQAPRDPSNATAATPAPGTNS